jgi:hypothetical protein
MSRHNFRTDVQQRYQHTSRHSSRWAKASTFDRVTAGYCVLITLGVILASLYFSWVPA